MRARAERFGAIVALESPPALVSIDRALARRIGLEGGALWDEPDVGLDVPTLRAPTEVHLAVTDRCPAGCTGCYANAEPGGHEPLGDDVRARLDALAAQGVFSVAFGGGEAALRDDVGELAAYARSLGLVPTLTTSGLGMTVERAKRMSAFAQINVSHDGLGDTYRRVRGFDGAHVAERAMRLLADAGIPFGANTVLVRESFDALEETAAHLDALGAVELQLLRFKPSGRGRLDYLARRLSTAQIDAFPAKLRALSERVRMGVRIDCALVPYLAGASAVTPEQLRSFAVMGCEAGRSLLAIKSDGRASPCSFWDGSAEQTTGAHDAWEHDATLDDFRAYAAEPPEPCASCPYRSVCRGGCRIVAGALGASPFAPDPECPRVRAHRTQEA